MSDLHALSRKQHPNVDVAAAQDRLDTNLRRCNWLARRLLQQRIPEPPLGRARHRERFRALRWNKRHVFSWHCCPSSIGRYLERPRDGLRHDQCHTVLIDQLSGRRSRLCTDWQTFRHKFAGLVKSLGVDAKVVQEMARHAPFGTTMKGYTQVFELSIRQAQEELAVLIMAR
jgi:integrase